MPLKEEAKLRMRRYLRRVDKALADDMPELIVAMEMHLLLSAATLYCGEELYAEIGKHAVQNARDEFGYCQYCDNEISCSLTHKPVCEHCDARHQTEYLEIEDDLEGDS